MRLSYILTFFLSILLYPAEKSTAEKNTFEKLPPIETIKKIKERGILRVAMHKKDHPPFFMIDEAGDLIGIDVELARLLAHQLGVKVVFDRSKGSFNEVVSLVANKACDIAISKISITMPRSEILLFTNPYITMSKALLVNRKKLTQLPYGTKIEDLFRLPDLSLGVIAGSSYEAFARRLVDEKNLFSNASWIDVIVPNLMKGKIWAAFRDEIEVRRTMYALKDAPLKLLAVNLVDQKDPISMVVHNENAMFRDYLNNFILVVYGNKKLSEEIKRFDKHFRKDQDV